MVGFDVRADVEFIQLADDGRPIEEDNPLDELLSMLHLVDGAFLDSVVEPSVAPIGAHLGLDDVTG